MAKRAAIYARVSGKKQDERIQLITCRAYCLENGFEIVEEVIDKFTGNSPVKDRPGGARVYELLATKSVDVIVMWVIDRVARDIDVLEYLLFKRDVKSYGAELHFTDIGKTSDDPTATQVEFAEAAGAAKERLKTIKRTSAGRKRKFTVDGQIVANGEVPFGYRKVGMGKEAQRVIDPIEGKLVGELFQDYLNGSSTWDLLDKLKASGTTPRRTAEWNKRQVLQILNYRGYIGEYKYSGDFMQKPDLAIVDKALFDAVKTRLQENQFSKVDRGREYLMAQHIRCFCDTGMTGSSSYNLKYYRCHKGQQQPADSGARCYQSVRADKIDKLAWGWLLSLATSQDGFNKLVAEMVANAERDALPIKNRLIGINAMIKDREAEIARLIRRSAKEEDDSIAAVWQTEIDRASTAKKGLITQREKALGELGQIDWMLDGRINPDRVRAEMNDVAGDGSFDHRRKMILKYDVRATLFKVEGAVKVLMSCRLWPNGEVLALDDPRMYVKGFYFLPSGVNTSNSCGVRSTSPKYITLRQLVSLEPDDLAAEFFKSAVMSTV